MFGFDTCFEKYEPRTNLRPGQNDTRGKMKQRDFSNDDAIYDVSHSN